MGRKAVLFAVITFSHSLGSQLQLLLALGTLFISLLAHVLTNPFLEGGPDLHMMEAASLSSSCFVFFVGLIYVDPKTSNTGRVIISVMILSLLVFMMIYLVGNLILELAKGIDGLWDDCDMATSTSTHLSTIVLARALVVRFRRWLWQQGLSTTTKNRDIAPSISMESQKMVAAVDSANGSPSIVFSNDEKAENKD